MSFSKIVFSDLNYNLSRLEDDIDNHLSCGEECNNLLLKNEKVEGLTEIYDFQCKLEKQLNFLFNNISNRCVEKWENECLEISNKNDLIEHKDDKLFYYKFNIIKDKIDLCKNVNNLFFKELNYFILNNSNAIFKKPVLGSSSNYTIFFLPEGKIGECRCCEETEREGRNAFSERLTMIVADYFDKSIALDIASVGSGLCFQELEVNLFLKREGYKIRQWTLVDPAMDLKTVENFRIIIKSTDPDTEVICFRENMNYYLNSIADSETGEMPHILLFIDIDSDAFLEEVDEVPSAIEDHLTHQCLLAEFSKRANPMNFKIMELT
jgi:hypothetical protein